MSRFFKITRKPYDDFIYKKSDIEINPGVTILTGCNGYGKTTLLQMMKEALHSSKIPVMYYSNEVDGGAVAVSSNLFINDITTAATLMQSSEGEQIYINFGTIASKIGKFIREHKEDKELWILFDAIDSGLSIDNMIEVKELLFETILNDTKGKDVFIICSANSYEMCRDSKCFDVYLGEYTEFKDYEDYRKYILKCRKQKDKRYKK